MPTENVTHEAKSAEQYDASAKQKAQAKTARIPIKVVAAETLKKPDWIRVKAGSPSTRFYEIKQILREHKLHTVCEEASCPNIGECFGHAALTGPRRDPFEGLGKIAALGIKVSQHRTYHGVALNVAMDLSPFEGIDPCGYAGLKTVDLAKIGVSTNWDSVARQLGDRLAANLAP